MKTACHGRGVDTLQWELRSRFRVRFHRQMAEFFSKQGSAAEGFGVVWEETLEEFPIDDHSQAELYRELIAWVRSDEVGVGHNEAMLLQAWKGTACDF